MYMAALSNISVSEFIEFEKFKDRYKLSKTSSNEIPNEAYEKALLEAVYSLDTNRIVKLNTPQIYALLRFSRLANAFFGNLPEINNDIFSGIYNVQLAELISNGLESFIDELETQSLTALVWRIHVPHLSTLINYQFILKVQHDEFVKTQHQKIKSLVKLSISELALTEQLKYLLLLNDDTSSIKSFIYELEYRLNEIYLIAQREVIESLNKIAFDKFSIRFDFEPIYDQESKILTVTPKKSYKIKNIDVVDVFMKLYESRFKECGNLYGIRDLTDDYSKFQDLFRDEGSKNLVTDFLSRKNKKWYFDVEKYNSYT